MPYGTFAVIIIGALFYFGDPYGNPRYRGPISDHFDGERFFNPGVTSERGFRDFLRWQLHSRRGVWSEFRKAPCGPPPPRVVEGDNLRVTFINHSTTLIQTAGLNILTDPVWSKRVGPVFWLGPRRHRSPGLRLEDLPKIDVVLLSHNHYDHLDIPTLRRIQEIHAPQFVVPLGVCALLDRKKLRPSIELDWWNEADLPHGIHVTCVPAQHFSVRGFRDHNRALWCGYVLEGPGGRIYFAGDTGYGPHLKKIAQKFAPVRLALLPIGAYKPNWFMSPVHISPRESLKLHHVIGAETSIAIHFGTFALADDGEKEAAQDLADAVTSAGEPAPRFWVLDFGDGRDLPPERPLQSPAGAVEHFQKST
ncbi:MAG: MBL fold metallo-hydrolase [Terriglobia bacterium]